jgi:hypothetical protein
MKKTNKVGIFAMLLMTVLGFSVAPVGATPVTLDYLISTDGTITVDDKLFSDFGFSSSGYGSFLPTGAAGINVEGSLVAGLPGLSFTGGMLAIGSSYVDFLIEYTVTVLDPNLLISDIHLAYNGAFAGNGFTNVVETVRDPASGIVLAQASVSNPPTDLSDPDAEPTNYRTGRH